MKLLFPIVMLLISQTTFAQMNSCLSQASNQDLLREIGKRMNSSSPYPGQGGVSVTFTCGGNAEVFVDSINLTNGQSRQLRISTGDWNRCKSYADTLTNKLSHGSISGKIFALCTGNAEVSKYTITMDGQIVLSSKTPTGDWNTCISSANSINDNL